MGNLSLAIEITAFFEAMLRRKLSSHTVLLTKIVLLFSTIVEPNYKLLHRIANCLTEL